MCHSATARPTHEVVVGRAVLVSWNPPAATQSKTFRGFCAACSLPHEARRRRVVVGWDTLVALWWVARDMFRPERRLPSRAGTPRPWQAAPRPWQGAALGRFGSNAPPLTSGDGGGDLWVARSHRREGRIWWAAPRAWWGAAVGRTSLVVCIREARVQGTGGCHWWQRSGRAVAWRVAKAWPSSGTQRTPGLAKACGGEGRRPSQTAQRQGIGLHREGRTYLHWPSCFHAVLTRKKHPGPPAQLGGRPWRGLGRQNGRPCQEHGWQGAWRTALERLRPCRPGGEAGGATLCK